MFAQTSDNNTAVNTKAAAWTVGVHVVLLLLFILVKYSSPVTAATPVEMGMEVNLGTDADGSGTDQPMAIGDPAPDRSERTHQAAAQEANEEKDMMKTDEADAPAIKPVQPNTVKNHNTPTNSAATPNRSHTQQPTQTATNNHLQPQRPRYVYNGATGTGGNGASEDHPGTSEGNTTGNGDRGVPGGTPGAANYVGSPGPGNGGINTQGFGSRGISPSVFQAEFHEGGKVVARVTVDRDGNITNIIIKSSPNNELTRIAKQKLSQAKFSKSTGSEPEQIGTVTIVFKARS
ncbi:energy transducer TonB [Taibaiella soli]|uniref:TonB C-terminal domain-containing protein n=1 Tax=Taibaiella soli TaxID=1649169 RepID=A0A2W2BG01_9BACT|nr:energy transducer TonB [Taibaiella soli]PZF72406.1 hypothetical protein DN068_13720 [Taibaiella soli]